MIYQEKKYEGNLGATASNGSHRAGQTTANRDAPWGEIICASAFAGDRVRRRSEQRRREAEARIRLLFEHSPDGIVVVDPTSLRFLEFNETAHQQLGYSRDEFGRLCVSDLETAESSGQTYTNLTEVIRDQWGDFEAQYRTRNGAIRNFHVTAQFTHLQGQSVYHRVQLEYHVAEIEFPLDQSVPCGLIVSELVSNALKHGFPDGRTGRIIVGLEAVGEHMVVLRVQDEGVGLPSDFDPNNTSSLGLQLVSGLAAQLGGQMEVEASNAPGAAFRVTFPLSRGAQVGGES